MINGVIIESLKIIPNEKGNIFHLINKNSTGYCGFGEVYISSVKKNIVKGWKKHSKMVMNLFVPYGEIKIVIFDDRDNSSTFGNFLEERLSRKNYNKITIPNGLWVAFQGLSSDDNLLINFSNIKHNPNESENIEIDQIKYSWD